jgi:putative endonuclease
VALSFYFESAEHFDLMFWVYVLENSAGKFYVGQTGNLAERVRDHNRTDGFEGHFARKNGPWKLVWSEVHDSRSSAVKRERQIKRMKSAKWIRAHLLPIEAAAVNPDKSGL